MTRNLRRAAEDPSRIVAQAKMIHDANGRATIVVEGAGDVSFFSQWLQNKETTVTAAGGKDNVKAVWRTAKERKVRLICITDIDYDIVTNTQRIMEKNFLNIAIVQDGGNKMFWANDLEGYLIRSDAFRKFILNLCSDFYDEKFANDLREHIRCGGSKVGAYRAALLMKEPEQLRPYTTAFGITSEFFSPHTLVVDDEELKKAFLSSVDMSNHEIDELAELAQSLYEKYGDGWKLCRGHDLTEMLSQHLAWRLHRKVTQREVEQCLRLAFEREMFQVSVLGTELTRCLKEMGSTALS